MASDSLSPKSANSESFQYAILVHLFSRRISYCRINVTSSVQHTEHLSAYKSVDLFNLIQDSLFPRFIGAAKQPVSIQNQFLCVSVLISVAQNMTHDAYKTITITSLSLLGSCLHTELTRAFVRPLTKDYLL